jgi:hypothetical protein
VFLVRVINRADVESYGDGCYFYCDALLGVESVLIKGYSFGKYSMGCGALLISMSCSNLKRRCSKCQTKQFVHALYSKEIIVYSRCSVEISLINKIC